MYKVFNTDLKVDGVEFETVYKNGTIFTQVVNSDCLNGYRLCKECEETLSHRVSSFEVGLYSYCEDCYSQEYEELVNEHEKLFEIKKW